MITEFFSLDTAQAETAVARFSSKAREMDASLEEMARHAELVALAEVKQARAIRLSEEATRKKADAARLAAQADRERAQGNAAQAAQLQAKSEKTLAASVELTKKASLSAAKAERARVQAQRLAEKSSKGVLTLQERLNRAMGRAVDLLKRQVAAGALLATTFLSVAGAARGLTDSVEAYSGFEHRMAGVQAVTQAAGQDFEVLTGRAEEMGETTLLSASQAASGMEFLGRSGFGVFEIFEAIPGVLDLAVAGALDLGQASDIVANIVRGFGLETEQTTFLVDVLAATAAGSNTDITMLGAGFKFVSSLASGLGLALPPVSAALGVLADAGLKAEMGGTGLRTAILKLANATPKTQKILESYGVSLEEVDFQGEGLVEVLARLGEAGISVTDAFEIAGLRGGNALGILVSNADKVAAFADRLEQSGGSAKAMADIMADTVRGALTLLGSRVEALQIQFGTTLEPRLRETIAALSDLAAQSGDTARTAASLVGGAMTALVSVLEAVVAHGDLLLGILAAVAAGLLGLPIASAVSSLWTLVSATTAVGVAQNVMLLATVRLREAWTALTLTMAKNPAGLAALGVAVLVGSLTVAAMRHAEAREEAERYHAALEAGYTTVEEAAAAQDDLLVRLEKERDFRIEATREIAEQKEKLEQLEPLLAQMSTALDLGDLHGYRQLAAEARELGVELTDLGRTSAFEQLASDVDLLKAKIARLSNDAESAGRSLEAMETQFGKEALPTLESTVDRRRRAIAVLVRQQEEVARLRREIDSLDYDPRNPDRYAAAVLRLTGALQRAEALATSAEKGIAAVNKTLGVTGDVIEKAGGKLNLFSRSLLLDASRASIDKLFATGELEKAEEILRRLPTDVLDRIFPGQTIEEILDWQRRLQSGFDKFMESSSRAEQEQARVAEESAKSLETLHQAIEEQRALSIARDLDQANKSFSRHVDLQKLGITNELALSVARGNSLDVLRFISGELGQQVEGLVAVAASKAEIARREEELAEAQKKALETDKKIREEQEEIEASLIRQGQELGERIRFDAIPPPEFDFDPVIPSGAGLIEDVREDWSDAIEALQGMWRAALTSIYEDGRLSFEALGEVVGDVFDRVFARMVDQAIESMFVLRQQGEGLPGLSGGGLGGGGLSSFFGDSASTASTVITVAAIAKTAFDIAESLIEGHKSKIFSLPITVSFSAEQGFSGQAIGGNIADETGLDFAQINATIRNQIQDLRIAIGGFLEFLPELAVQVRRDGEAFKLSVGGMVIGAFDTLQDAIQAGLELALRDADFSGLGRNMQALLRRLASIGLENADPYFELARALDSVGVNDVTLAFQNLDTLFSVHADRVREMGGSEADLLRLRTEALRELGEQVRDTLGSFVEGFDAIRRVRELLKALQDAEAFNAGIGSEAAFRDRFAGRFGEDGSTGRVRGGGPDGGGNSGFRVTGPNLEGGLVATAAALETAAATSSGALAQTVSAMGTLQVASRDLAASSGISERSLDQLALDLEGLRRPASDARKNLVDLGNAAGEIAAPLTRLPDELRDAAADIPPAIESAFAQLAIENEADRLRASLSSGLADFLGNEQQRREAERLTHQLKLGQMRLELEALRLLAQETGVITQDVIDRYDRLLSEAERRFAAGEGPGRRGGGGSRRAEREAQDRRRDELQAMIDELRSDLTGAAAEIARTREETTRLTDEMRELGIAEEDIADFTNRRAEADAARARESQLGAMAELARLAGDQEQIALLEREAALARIDTIESEMEALHVLGVISDEAWAAAQAAADAARQGVRDTWEAEHGLQARRRAYLDELGRLVPEIADFRAYRELRTFLEELPQHAEELGLASERLRNQVTRGLELNFFDSLSRFSGFDDENARQREKELRDRQALANLRLQLALLEQFGALSEAQLEQYRGWVAEVEEGLLTGTTVIDRDQIRQDLSSFIPSLATVLEVERTIAFFTDLDARLRSIGATEEEIQAARQEATEALFVTELERLARATGNEEALRIAADLRHQMEVANYRLRLQLLEQEGILTAAEAAVIRGLIDEFETIDPGSGGGGVGGPIRYGNDDFGRRPPPSRENRNQQIEDLDELRAEIDGILDGWRAVPLEDVTRQARDLLSQRAELDDMIRRLREGRAELALGDVELPDLEEAFAAARGGFLGDVLGDDSELDALSQELQGIFTHFSAVRSALEELGGTAQEFGRVAEAEAQRIARFEEKLFAPIDAELEEVRGVSRSDVENRRIQVAELRQAVARFEGGDLTAAADAVSLSQSLRSQIDAFENPGERRALLAFLEAQLGAIRETGVPTQLDPQEQIADLTGQQLQVQERIADLLDQQVELMRSPSLSESPRVASPLPGGGPTAVRLEVVAPPTDRAFVASMDKRLGALQRELTAMNKKLERLTPIASALTTGNQLRQQMLSELKKPKGVKT